MPSQNLINTDNNQRFTYESEKIKKLHEKGHFETAQLLQLALLSSYFLLQKHNHIAMYVFFGLNEKAFAICLYFFSESLLVIKEIEVSETAEGTKLKHAKNG